MPIPRICWTGSYARHLGWLGKPWWNVCRVREREREREKDETTERVRVHKKWEQKQGRHSHTGTHTPASVITGTTKCPRCILVTKTIYMQVIMA